MAIATGAAGNIVAYMMSGRVDALREGIARIFRHAPDEQQADAQRALDTDAVALTEQSEQQPGVSLRWATRLAMELNEHPEVRQDVAALARLNIADHLRITFHSNTGSGPYVAGNNNGLIFMQRDRKAQ